MFSLSVGLLPAGANTPPLNPPPTAQSSADFNVAEYFGDPWFRKHIDFWTKVYTHYNSTQALVHDAKHVNIVYEMIDFTNQPRGRSRDFTGKMREKWRRVLTTLHEREGVLEKMTEEERRVFRLFDEIDDPNRFLEAARRKRIRMQTGLRQRFKESIELSGLYLSRMEEEFRKAGVPPILTRIPFVESSFNVNAKSKVGASGIWQFIKSTGRLYLTINDAVDERNDPILSAAAAAKLLRANYDALGNWPLAIVAYNHGRMGIMRGVRKVDSSHIKDVLKNYRSRMFGFASQNYFMEFLAAAEIEANADRYFLGVQRMKPIDYVEVEVRDYVSASVLIKFLGIPRRLFKEYNPALTDAVYKDELRIPKGYSLRLPADWARDRGGPIRAYWDTYRRMPASTKHRRQPL